MVDSPEPGRWARRFLLRRGLGVGVMALIGMRVRNAAAERVQVTIDNYSFSPVMMITSIGSTVTWVNQDDTQHSIVCPALNIKSEPLDPDDIFSHQFDDPGTFDYMCGLHPQMRGQVVVQ